MTRVELKQSAIDYKYGRIEYEQFETAVEAFEQALLQQAHVMQGRKAEPLAVDAVEFIANALGEEVRLRQMIDLWCIDQFGNTDEALEKADAMFTAARDIFYKSANGA